MLRPKIGIIGAGVVGTAVGVVLHEKGYEITGAYDIRPESTQLLAKRTGCCVAANPEDVARSADLIFITPCDSAIQNVVETLADRGAIHSGHTMVHMSGAQSSEILDRAKEFGARVLSVHPLQSFANPDMAIENLPGSVFSIEGDRQAFDVAVCIVETLGGEYFFIDRKAKPLYHAGACVVSNYLVTIIDFGVKLLESTGIPKNMATRALLPLINGTLHNIENIGIPKSLTGPIARGDLSTIIKHLDCLEEMAPELTKLYGWLGYYTAQIALEKGSIDKNAMEKFQKVFMQELARVGSAQ
ncbi:MAG: oxidoreductase, coenzyme F420-dependent [Firmicutes bacterium]|nr:oxidoreductase, coenzyme F420-dependent [Bacillota bacterium]